MNFQEYLAIRNMENPLDFVTRIVVKSVYPEAYFVSPCLNNGVVFVKEKYNSDGVYFDVYGNMAKTTYEDPVTKNRIAVDIQEALVPTKNGYRKVTEYVGDLSVEKLKDYLLVCPMLYTALDDDTIKKHGDSLLQTSVDSLRKHFKLFCWHGLDRGFNDRYVHNIRGAALASNITGGLNKLYRKYLEAQDYVSEESIKNVLKKCKSEVVDIENYQARVEKLFALSTDCIKEGF